MIRARLLWFSIGFASASAAISHFVVKDLWTERESLSSQLLGKFSYLEGRVSNLESVIISKPNLESQEKWKNNIFPS